MADGFFTCGVAPIGTGPAVFGQVGLMNARVNETLTATLSLAEQLATYQVSNISFDVDPTPIHNLAIRDVDSEIELDDIPTTTLPSVPDIGALSITTPALPSGEPEAPADPPNVVIPTTPAAYHPSFGLTPTLNFPTAPSYGDLTGGIPFPDLREITLPGAPVVDFGIPFTATPPRFTAPPPDASDFNYTEQAYSPLLVSELQTAIRATLNGETGIPRVVEDALWAREAEREAQSADASRRDVFDSVAARGFTLPNGPLLAALAKVRQNSQNQKNALGRDVMIRIHEVLVDQFKYGLAQGIALENTWVQLYTTIQDRRLQAAQVAVNIAIQVYNALVAQYQAAAQVYEVEAEVYKARIQAELAKLQAYSEQLKGLQLIGELNEQDVRIYTARLQAVEMNVRAYVADIQAYSEKINGEKLKLDAFRTTIEIEDEKLKASQTEIEIYKGKLEGQQLVQTAAQTRAQTYLGFVQAWKTKYEAQIDRQRGEIAAGEADTARFAARIQGLVAQFNAIVSRAQVLVANNNTKVQKFSADVSAVNAYNTAAAEKFRAINEALTNQTQIVLKNGEINAQNGLAAQQLMEQALQTAVQVLAQMTSSFASSVNMNANVSDGTNFSQSCSYITSQSLS